MSYYGRVFEELVQSGDDFSDALYGDGPSVNPDAGYEPAPEGKCRVALRGISARLAASAAWDVQPEAEEALAFAVWSLACWAARQNKPDGWVLSVVAEETSGYPVMNDDLQGILAGDSPWLDQFGAVG